MSLVPYLHVDRTLQEAQAGDEVPLGPDHAHHLARVLRLRAGAEVEVADGDGYEAPGHLDDDDATTVILAAASRQQPPRRPRLTVAQALAKGRKLDDVVRACTELGADRFIPVAAERSVTTLRGDKAMRAIRRWDAVARSAAEQSRRPSRPPIDPIMTVADLLREPAKILIADPSGSTPVRHCLDGIDSDEVVLAVGPEGGWADAEVAAAHAAGACVVPLGGSILRTEHAAAALLAACSALVGRWG